MKMSFYGAVDYIFSLSKLILNINVVIIDEGTGDFVEDPNTRRRIRYTETGQTKDCAENYRYKHRYGWR